MSDHHYAAQYPGYASGYDTYYPLVMGAARFGAVVGASGAAAHNLQRMRNEGLTWQQAAADTARVGVLTGAATAAAAAAGSVFHRHPWLSLAATLATGTAVMYLAEDIARRRQAAAEAEVTGGGVVDGVVDREDGGHDG
jgi:hypothetical protein